MCACDVCIRRESQEGVGRRGRETKRGIEKESEINVICVVIGGVEVGEAEGEEERKEEGEGAGRCKWLASTHRYELKRADIH